MMKNYTFNMRDETKFTVQQALYDIHIILKVTLLEMAPYLTFHFCRISNIGL